MRKFSLKRQKLNRSVKEFRSAFVAELRLCEYCRKRPPILHEISRGSTRAASLDKRFAVLGLCDPTCHLLVGSWCRAKQLALLLLKRPLDFNLEAYHQLIRRRTPEMSEVEHYLQELKEIMP